MKRMILILVLALGACARNPAQPGTLTVMTHDSFSISKNLVQEFESANTYLFHS